MGLLYKTILFFNLSVFAKDLPSLKDCLATEVLNVKKSVIKIAENILKFEQAISKYWFDHDYKFISQDCQRHPQILAKKWLSGFEHPSLRWVLVGLCLG